MIFVFGSNEEGQHGGGAAFAAFKYHGAIMGAAIGHWGNSYAIPTCKWTTGKPGFEITITKLKEYVEGFIDYAIQHPELEFQVTQVGCGLAGWSPIVVAPMFRAAPDNCQFDTAWKEWLPKDFKFWGTR